MNARGFFIVIDGTDGSGKGTQTKLLVDRLRSEGRAVEVLDFPRYGQPSAYFVERYLRGEYGSLQEVGAKRASLFYALDRYDISSSVRDSLAEGKVVVSNRYVSASKGHQTAKIRDPQERRAFVAWLNDLEYNILGIPRPNLTVLLHVPADIGFELVASKEARAYLGDKKRDIHEQDHEHLRAAERAYLELPTYDTMETWRVLPCAEGNKLFSIEEIHERLWQLVTSLLT